MIRTRTRWFPPALALLVVALLGARAWLAAAYGMTSVNNESLADSLIIMLAFMPYLVVGLVLLLRRPEHRLSWVMTAIGVLTALGALGESYATLALVARPEAGLPGGVFAAWIQNWYWFSLLGLMFFFLPLLFPTGRPLSPRWNWLYVGGSALVAVVVVLSWMKPTLTGGSLDDPAYSVANPIGVEAVGDLEQTTLGDVLFIGLLAIAVCALASLVIRFRRSRGLERQQMKLFVFAGALMIVLPVAEELGLSHILPESNLFFAVAVALPPVAVGIAVLKYRLYDIDRIISRTLTYALLTALLIGLYLVAVTTLTTLTAGVAGESPLAVAAATLLAAAAFGPARRRIQRVVDRRFNRARYDAERTIAAYRARLRDELNLAAITADLGAAVQETVQPTQSFIWLRTEQSR